MKRVRGPYATDLSDFSARVDLTGLPAGQDIFYRVQFEDIIAGTLSEPMPGHFRTAPTRAGGMRIYEAMRKRDPDFFIHSGDTIYADGPMQAEVKLPDGSLWRNDVLTEEKSKVAETLKEFRGNYRYNQLDANVRRFNSEVMQIWQWDDHEVTNNWSPSKDLAADKRYTEKSLPWLTERATRAFLENAPMRWHAQDEEARVYRKLAYGPLHSGGFGPNQLDRTFGPEVKFFKAPRAGIVNESPMAGGQYFGEVEIDGKTAAMTVHLREINGASLWSTTLAPQRG